MKQILLAIAIFGLLAAACDHAELKREIPSSPKESYEELPR